MGHQLMRYSSAVAFSPRQKLPTALFGPESAFLLVRDAVLTELGTNSPPSRPPEARLLLRKPRGSVAQGALYSSDPSPLPPKARF